MLIKLFQPLFSKQKPRLRRRTMELLYTHLLILLLFTVDSQPYEFNKADDKERLVLNDVQEVYTFCRHHTLQYEVDFQGITEIKSKLSEAIYLLNGLCNNIHLNYICSPLIKEIDLLFNNLKQQSKTHDEYLRKDSNISGRNIL